MQALSRVEEQAIIELAKKDALKICDPQVKAFAECTTGRTFSAAWACKNELAAWQDCMRANVTEDKLDKLKLDFIRHREERKKQMTEQAKKDRIESYKRHAGIKDPKPEQAPPS